MEDNIMKTLLTCEFNMDTASVELRYSDGSMISIDCTAVEAEVVNKPIQFRTLETAIRNLSLKACVSKGISFRYLERTILLEHSSSQQYYFNQA